MALLSTLMISFLKNSTMSKYTIKTFKGMKYYCVFPQKFDYHKAYPLVIYLHGAGEREKISDIRIRGLLYEVDNGLNLDCIIIAPFCEGLKTWFDYAERLIQLVDIYRHKEYVDINKVSVTGISMGGFGTWHLGMAHPEWFSAIAPVCGGGYSWNVKMLKYVKVWTFHGNKDTTVPYVNTKIMVHQAKEEGVNIKFTTYKNWNHNVWEPTYKNKKVTSWLISQVRNEKYGNI